MTEARTTVIIPFHNEEDSVHDVLTELRQTMPRAEVIAIDDGSTDATREAISSHSGVRLLSFDENRGQSAALYAGIMNATGDYVILMDGDGQHDPQDIPRLLECMNSADYVCGYRHTRQDSPSRIIASRTANLIRNAILSDKARDTGSIKAIRKDHAKHLVLFDGLHRYIPAFLSNAGLSMIEIPVSHRPRKKGKAHYSILGRAIRGVPDMIRVRAILKEQRKRRNE